MHSMDGSLSQEGEITLTFLKLVPWSAQIYL